jgi:hypothetical protein
MFHRIRRTVARWSSEETRAAMAETKARFVELSAYRSRMAAVVLGLRNRLQAVENQRDYARGEIFDLKSDLADVQLELRKAQDDLTAAENENKRLWSIAERDQARVELDLARYNRERADLEVPRREEEG